MSKKQKLLLRLSNNQKNVRFDDLVLLAQYLGFEIIEINGSHHQFRHPILKAKLNFQPNRDQAKTYQVRQLLKLIEELGIQLEDE
jgi:predicted RNA binding protein YcfA (HicA-like mRNA interferase family)